MQTRHSPGAQISGPVAPWRPAGVSAGPYPLRRFPAPVSNTLGSAEDAVHPGAHNRDRAVLRTHLCRRRGVRGLLLRLALPGAGGRRRGLPRAGHVRYCGPGLAARPQCGSRPGPATGGGRGARVRRAQRGHRGDRRGAGHVPGRRRRGLVGHAQRGPAGRPEGRAPRDPVRAELARLLRRRPAGRAHRGAHHPAGPAHPGAGGGAGRSPGPMPGTSSPSPSPTCSLRSP